MAARKGRRRRKSARRSTKRRAVAHASNPPKRRRSARHRYRRNPPAFSIKGITDRVMEYGIGGACVVGGELISKEATSLLVGDNVKALPGSVMRALAEVGVATGVGLAAERFVGRQIGRDLAVGGYAGAMREIVKSLGVKKINDILGGAAGVNRYVVRNGRVMPLNGYNSPANQRLNGYANRSGYSILAGEQEEELGY